MSLMVIWWQMKWVNKQTGFTIVELLIVVVVIAILAAITIVSFANIQTRARDSSRDTAVRTMRTALENYANLNGGLYPNACGTVSSGCGTSQLASWLVPEHINSIPPDPKSGTTIDYVVGPNFTAYGMLVRYETKPQCKVLVGQSPSVNWWGAGVPVC